MIYFIVQDCSLLFHYFTRVQCSFQARYMIVLNKVCEDSLLKIYHSFLLIHCRIYSSSVLCTYKCIYNEKWYDKYICYYDLLRISGWSFSKTIIYFIRSIYIYISYALFSILCKWKCQSCSYHSFKIVGTATFWNHIQKHTSRMVSTFHDNIWYFCMIMDMIYVFSNNSFTSVKASCLKIKWDLFLRSLSLSAIRFKIFSLVFFFLYF